VPVIKMANPRHDHHDERGDVEEEQRHVVGDRQTTSDRQRI
jgi:hypothetical protein